MACHAGLRAIRTGDWRAQQRQVGMQEFELIGRIFRQAAYAQAGGAVEQSIGDDCALIRVPDGHQLCVSTDSVLAGVHFPWPCDAFLLGQRALAVAVSDLAACGAEPLAFTLALSLPQPDVAWLEALSRGLAHMATQCGIRLAGGDTTAGPLNIGITVMGSVPAGQALLRSTARAGELLYVSGPLGAAAAALSLFADNPPSLADDVSPSLLQAFWQPQPQLALGLWLRGRAGAAIDISDGLLADASHIATESAVQLQIEQAKVPVSVAARQADPQRAVQRALSGGDDYQLLFSLPQAHAVELEQQFPLARCIGRVTVGQGVRLLDEQGHELTVDQRGYQHFQTG